MGGRLKYFLSEWKKITNDKWVLSVIKDSLKLEFLSKPPFTGVRQTKVNAKNLSFFTAESRQITTKRGDRNCPCKRKAERFLFNIFLVRKKKQEN